MDIAIAFLILTAALWVSVALIRRRLPATHRPKPGRHHA